MCPPNHPTTQLTNWQPGRWHLRRMTNLTKFALSCTINRSLNDRWKYLNYQEKLMPDKIVLIVNEKPHTILAAPDTPLLYVLRNELGLNGPHFGCGGEKCGACMVLVGAKPTPSCHLPISEIGSFHITTLEGLIEDGVMHPVQQAFIEEQATQCGYCVNGMIITTAALLLKNFHPTDKQIRAALDGNLCRCGAHLRILRAVRRAEKLMWGRAAQ